MYFDANLLIQSVPVYVARVIVTYGIDIANALLLSFIAAEWFSQRGNRAATRSVNNTLLLFLCLLNPFVVVPTLLETSANVRAFVLLGFVLSSLRSAGCFVVTILSYEIQDKSSQRVFFWE